MLYHEIKCPTLTKSGPCNCRTQIIVSDRPAPQAKRLRERCQSNIFTVQEPYPEVTKKIVRQLLSALEAAERYIAAQPLPLEGAPVAAGSPARSSDEGSDTATPTTGAEEA